MKLPNLKKNKIYVLLFVVGVLIFTLHIMTRREGMEGKNTSQDQGIPREDIPKGQEDLYILKSEIVPPVCPKCPSVIQNCPKQEKCQPCPPCGRCPEPQFTCKKVPNYNVRQTGDSSSDGPQPWRSSLSTFI